MNIRNVCTYKWNKMDVKKTTPHSKEGKSNEFNKIFFRLLFLLLSAILIDHPYQSKRGCGWYGDDDEDDIDNVRMHMFSHVCIFYYDDAYLNSSPFLFNRLFILNAAAACKIWHSSTAESPSWLILYIILFFCSFSFTALVFFPLCSVVPTE